MSNWNESEHPRDEDGKFTYKNGGASTSSGNSVQDRADILYPTMKNTEPKVNYNFKGLDNYKNENLSREDLLYPTMKSKKDDRLFTRGAVKIVTDEISGVKKGEPMTIEEAIKDVNPNYVFGGNATYKKNCQSCVVVTEARIRGFNLNVDIEYESEFKDKISERPNIAFIDPDTGEIPEFTNLKVADEAECEIFLNNTIKQNERYIFGFTWKSLTNERVGHVLIASKNENNELEFYDPQDNTISDISLLKKIKFKYDWTEEYCPPKILRIDNKELNYNILNRISKPAEIRKIKYYIPK